MSLYKNPLFIPWIQPVSWLCHEVCWVCRFSGSVALQPGLVLHVQKHGSRAALPGSYVSQHTL